MIIGLSRIITICTMAIALFIIILDSTDSILLCLFDEVNKIYSLTDI